jgi:hypothetical protein
MKIIEKYLMRQIVHLPPNPADSYLRKTDANLRRAMADHIWHIHGKTERRDRHTVRKLDVIVLPVEDYMQIIYETAMEYLCEMEQSK